jgi:hypothetical protein
VHEARRLYEQWPEMGIGRKRTIVETVFERIEIKGGENGRTKIAITYSGLPSSEELCINQQRMAPATRPRLVLARSHNQPTKNDLATPPQPHGRKKLEPDWIGQPSSTRMVSGGVNCKSVSGPPWGV